MLAVLEEATAELCDDCVTERVGWPRRQMANMVGRRMEEEGLVGRERGLCPGCSKEKVLNVLLDRDPPVDRDPRAPDGRPDAAAPLFIHPLPGRTGIRRSAPGIGRVMSRMR